MYPTTLALRKRPAQTQLELRKAKRTAPWMKKLNAIIAAGAGTFAARRAIAKKNNVFSYPRGVINLQRRALAVKKKVQNNENLRRMKIEGFKVSRFYIQTINCAGGNETFDKAGYMRALTTTYINDASAINPVTTAYNDPPFMIQSFESFTFCPQWPGSTVASFGRAVQGSGVQAKFGLLPSNGAYNNNNFKWNSRAVSVVYPFNTNANMAIDLNDLAYDRISVYKTYVTIDLFNYSGNRAVEVFIFRIRFKDEKYYDNTDATCKDIDGSLESVLNLMTQGQDGNRTIQNRYALERMIRAKKLPKAFKVKSCRRVTLSAALTGEFATPLQGGQIPAKSYKKIKMRFGSRLWMRTGCSNATQLIQDQLLKENYNKVDHILMIALPHQGSLLEPAQSSLTETIRVGFRITKTNVWKEHLN